MAVLEVLVYPDERLKQVSAPVTLFDDELTRFVADLEETMRSFPGCIGLAAPQVNRFARIALVDLSGRQDIPSHGRLVLINPLVHDEAGRVVGREGCLSVPDYTGNVARPQRIGLRAQDTRGDTHDYRFEGFEARAVLHELDHLEGRLFLDRLVSRRELFRRKVYRK